MIVSNREDHCDTLLGKVSNKFQGSWIEIKQLEDNFSELDEHAIVLEKEQYAWAFILSLGLPVLVTLYRECEATKWVKMSINGGGKIFHCHHKTLKHCTSLICVGKAMKPEYIPWFKHHGKPYLLPIEARSEKIHLKRPQQLPQNPRSKLHSVTGSSSASTQQGAQMFAPHFGQFPPYFPVPFTNPIYFTQAPYNKPP
ncbi:hypothetical protein GOBAR_AA30327 [Gossypium barbadense]|uniref:Uncharacterized protein n=1 Tax=Gossypium barbadense TaxID=3634 RepID=A0A2P5WGY3_GOSBA|nr:hypothetical protein GOBAR_AA30327 [Gossypium barbadense]